MPRVFETQAPNIDNENYIIFASDLPESDTEKYLQALEVNYKKLQGKYKGQEEISYIVNKQVFPLVRVLTVQQESVLLLSMVQNNGMRAAGLVYKDGSYQALGYMEHVTKLDAENADGYTYDATTKTYYVAR